MTLLPESLFIEFFSRRLLRFLTFPPYYIRYLITGAWIIWIFMWKSMISLSKKHAKLDLFTECSTRLDSASILLGSAVQRPGVQSHLPSSAVSLSVKTFVTSAGLEHPPRSLRLVKQKQKCAFTFWLKTQAKVYKTFKLETNFSVISWTKYYI